MFRRFVCAHFRPATAEDRIANLGKLATGFIYVVSVSGVTGARATVNNDLPAFLARIRAHTDLPLVVGFGISKREHVVRQLRHCFGPALVPFFFNPTRAVQRALLSNRAESSGACNPELAIHGAARFTSLDLGLIHVIRSTSARLRMASWSGRR